MNSRPPVKPDHGRAVQARHRRVQAPGADDHLHLWLARQLGHPRSRRFRVDRPPLRSPRQEALAARWAAHPCVARTLGRSRTRVRSLLLAGAFGCTARAAGIREHALLACRRGSAERRPPFALRARLLTPLDGGRDPSRGRRPARRRRGRPARLRRRRPGDRPDEAARAIDLRPWVVLPGMVDLHAHLPQLPNAGSGLRARPPDLAGPGHLPDRARRGPIRPSPSGSRRRSSRRSRPPARRRSLAYGVVYEAAMDAAFRAAEAHGIRAILGKVMMDRDTYDPTIEPSTILDRSLREIGRPHRALARRRRRPARLCRHAAVRDLVHAPRCCASRRRSPRATGAWWQTHVIGGPVRDRRGARGSSPTRSTTSTSTTGPAASASGPILAHAIHLSDRELARLVETGTRVAHCPASNLFIGAGVMPLGALSRGRPVGGPRVGRLRRPGRLDLLGHAGRGLRPDGAPLAGRTTSGAILDAARLAPAGVARRGAGARARRRDRLARGRQGGRPHRGRSGARRGRSRVSQPTTTRPTCEPADLPGASGHGPRRRGSAAGAWRAPDARHDRRMPTAGAWTAARRRSRWWRRRSGACEHRRGRATSCATSSDVFVVTTRLGTARASAGRCAGTPTPGRRSRIQTPSRARSPHWMRCRGRRSRPRRSSPPWTTAVRGGGS